MAAGDRRITGTSSGDVRVTKIGGSQRIISTGTGEPEDPDVFGRKGLGGDDAPRKRETERERIARLREEQAYVDDLAEKAKLAAQIKKMEVEEGVKELADTQERLALAMRQKDEEMILLLDDELRRNIIKLWLN